MSVLCLCIVVVVGNVTHLSSNSGQLALTRAPSVTVWGPVIGFRKQPKKTWHIIFNKGDDRIAIIYFSERDANKFSSKVGEGMAGVE